MADAQVIIVWLSLIVILFVLILGYTTMSRVYTSGIVEDIENITEVNESTDESSVINGTKTVWQYFLYIVFLAFILWAVFASGG